MSDMGLKYYTEGGNTRVGGRKGSELTSTRSIIDALCLQHAIIREVSGATDRTLADVERGRRPSQYPCGLI